MYPILLISKKTEHTQEFIALFQKEKGFSPAYIFEISPLKTEMTIDQMRELKKDIITSTKEKRLIILHSFDKANIEAQNALLKTLEEKNESNQFILVVQRMEQVLPTIRSRSQIVYASTDAQEHLVRESTQELLNKILTEKTYAFLSHTSIQAITKEETAIILEEIMVFIRSNLIQDKKTPQILKKLLQLFHQLQSNNLNPQLTIDQVLILVKKTYNS